MMKLIKGNIFTLLSTMKKLFILLSLLALVVVGCGKKEEAKPVEDATSKVIKVGATPVPHSEILNAIKEDLAAKGYTLEIVEFTDYVTPNIALNDGQIDANFFQHVPYMESFAKDKGLKLVSAGKVHVEPLGLYSQKFKSVEELPEGATIAIPNDPSNGGRALILLQSKGLIKLKADAGLDATEADIAENPKKFVFKALEAAQLPRTLQDVDASIINGNYALESKLNPVNDSILLEGADSPYANIVTVVEGHENDEKIKVLIETLQSEKVKKFIAEKYNGGVVPAF